ncbi:MAG: nuclear transport factor 2 family protein [Thermoleophilia bacterium]|nr:nuclear transport factor 2 family protein [Thermoleophilia bacterium]
MISEAVRGQVVAANQAFYDAFARRDLDALMACWADAGDVACIHPGGTPLCGHDLVRTSWEGLIDGDADGFTVHPDIVSVTYEDPVATVVCMERFATHGHGGGTRADLVATNVFVLGPGGWRMVVHHASPVM